MAGDTGYLVILKLQHKFVRCCVLIRAQEICVPATHDGTRGAATSRALIERVVIELRAEEPLSLSLSCVTIEVPSAYLAPS